MADDKPIKSTPPSGRKVRFEDPPNIFKQSGSSSFTFTIAPPNQESSSGARDTSVSLPTQSHHPRFPPANPQETDFLRNPFSDNKTSFDNKSTSDQKTWSPERASGGTEGSKASPTKSASPLSHKRIGDPQQLTPSPVQHFLYSYGDVRDSLESTRRVLDELVTDFVTEVCFEASRSAQLAGRQKIKIDDIRFACRKSPIYLGKIQDIQEKKEAIDNARKTLDVNDDKITKSNVKAAMEEPPLGDGDDDPDMDTQVPRGKGK